MYCVYIHPNKTLITHKISLKNIIKINCFILKKECGSQKMHGWLMGTQLCHMNARVVFQGTWPELGLCSSVKQKNGVSWWLQGWLQGNIRNVLEPYRQSEESSRLFNTAYLVCSLMSWSDYLLEMMGLSLPLGFAQLWRDVLRVQHTQKEQPLP